MTRVIKTHVIMTHAIRTHVMMTNDDDECLYDENHRDSCC